MRRNRCTPVLGREEYARACAWTDHGEEDPRLQPLRLDRCDHGAELPWRYGSQEGEYGSHDFAARGRRAESLNDIRSRPVCLVDSFVSTKAQANSHL